MTREEKERIQQKLHRAADAHLNAYGGNLYHEGIARGLEQAAGIVGKVRCEEEPHWIPCSKRLPDKEKKTYWICTDTGCQGECRWTNNLYGLGESDRWEWSIFDIPRYAEVVAWMPLPEPYEERREDD